MIVDQEAFEELVRTHRGELHVHCYRMLGSVVDAEDLVQETLLRAWRARTTFQERASPRTWLYRIATNACLTALAHRPPRVLPEDTRAPPGEVAWLEPYPDRLLETVADAGPGPEAVYDEREATELAFVAALQHLPPRQRAVVLMRNVVGLGVAEVADHLDSSREAVSSAHQRARATLAEHVRPGAAPSRKLNAAEHQLLERYVAAWESDDVDALVQLLAEDVVLSMPPMPDWFAGPAAVRGFLAWGVGTGGAWPVSAVPNLREHAAGVWSLRASSGWHRLYTAGDSGADTGRRSHRPAARLCATRPVRRVRPAAEVITLPAFELRFGAGRKPVSVSANLL